MLCLDLSLCEGEKKAQNRPVTTMTFKSLVTSSRIAYVLLLLHVHQTLLAYDLTIIHTNDVHDRMVQFNSRGGRCDMEDAEQGECYGGVARRATVINDIRNTVPNVLFLDAGDQFQGTNWFFVYKGSSTSHFMNRLGYDVQVSSALSTISIKSRGFFYAIVVVDPDFTFNSPVSPPARYAGKGQIAKDTYPVIDPYRSLLALLQKAG